MKSMGVLLTSRNGETQIYIRSSIITLEVMSFAVCLTLAIYWQLIPYFTNTEEFIIRWMFFLSFILLLLVTIVLIVAMLIAYFNLWPTRKKIGT